MRRIVLALLAVTAGAIAASPAAAQESCAAGNPAVFTYSGGEQCWVVPAGVTSINVLAIGAPGDGAAKAGKGDRVYSAMAVTPGQTLYINVGGAGSGATGGYNGGGTSIPAPGFDGSPYPHSRGFGGGGASDVRA